MKKKAKRILAVVAVGVILSLSVVTASATSGVPDDATTALSALNTLWGKLTGIITIGNVAAAIGIGLAVAAAFFFMWWGLRKLVRMITAAFKKGRVSV